MGTIPKGGFFEEMRNFCGEDNTPDGGRIQGEIWDGARQDERGMGRREKWKSG